MFRIFHRASRVFVCAAIAFAAAGPARGVQVPIVPLQIFGVDSVCSGWTPGGTVSAPTLTCVPAGGGGPAPFFCSWTNGPPAGAIAPGTAVNLQINCVGGSAPYTYLWTPGNSTAASLSVSPTVTTAFSVTARDSASGTQTLPATVTVSSGGGGGGGPINCAASAIGATITGTTQVLDLDWNNPLLTVRAAGLSQADAVVVRITTGAAGGYGKISGAEYGGISAGRFAVLSTRPCDFSYPPPLGWGATSIGNTVEILFASANGSDPFGNPSVPPNTTVYFNLRTTGNCGGNCGMLFQLNKY